MGLSPLIPPVFCLTAAVFFLQLLPFIFLSLSFLPLASSSSTSSPPPVQGQSFGGTVFSPYGVAYDGLGHVWVTATGVGSIVEFSLTGVELSSFAFPGEYYAATIAFDSAGLLYVGNGGSRVVTLANNGTFIRNYTTANPPLNGPAGVAIDIRNDDLWIADTYNMRVVQLSPNGTQLTVVKGGSLDYPYAVAVDLSGNVFITQSTGTGDDPVLKWSVSNGGVSTFYAGGLLAPQAVTVDWLGNVYVPDTNNQRIVQLSPQGALLQSFTTTSPAMNYPLGVAVDSAGNLYAADEGNNRIIQFLSATRPIPQSSSSSPRALSSSAAVSSSSSLRSSNSSPLRSSSSVAQSSTSPPLSSTASPTSSSAHASSPSSSSSTASTSSVTTGTLCILSYSLVGTIDFPWSTATSLSFTYDPIPITTPYGTAIALINATGSRTFTNRFGTSTTIPLTAIPKGLIFGGTFTSDNHLYLNATTPIDVDGLSWQMQTAVQLPGVNPQAYGEQVTVYNSSGVVVETQEGAGDEGVVDQLGQAFLSSVPTFLNKTIPASNVNALAVDYTTCQAPITFTNGLRPPTQPAASNGATLISYSYFVSDGVTYSVQANLSITTSSAFATMKDILGNPHQSVVNLTGTRVYIYLPTSTSLTSVVTFQPLGFPGGDQRFYPYSLLASAPAVYTVSTAPFLDAAGLEFAVSPPVPLVGKPLSSSPSYGLVVVSMSNQGVGAGVVLTDSTAVINEDTTIVSPPNTPPLISLQRQTYVLG